MYERENTEYRPKLCIIQIKHRIYVIILEMFYNGKCALNPSILS